MRRRIMGENFVNRLDVEDFFRHLYHRSLRQQSNDWVDSLSSPSSPRLWTGESLVVPVKIGVNQDAGEPAEDV